MDPERYETKIPEEVKKEIEQVQKKLEKFLSLIHI